MAHVLGTRHARLQRCQWAVDLQALECIEANDTSCHFCACRLELASSALFTSWAEARNQEHSTQFSPYPVCAMNYAHLQSRVHRASIVNSANLAWQVLCGSQTLYLSLSAFFFRK